MSLPLLSQALAKASLAASNLGLCSAATPKLTNPGNNVGVGTTAENEPVQS